MKFFIFFILITVNTPIFAATSDLFIAVQIDDVARAEKLIDAGENVNSVNQLGETVLHYAAYMHAPKVAALLIKKGANIEAENQKKQSPLLVAIDAADVELTSLLLNRGASIHHTDQSGNGAMINCILFSKYVNDFQATATALVKLVLAHGGNINETDKAGNTLLLFAANDLLESLLLNLIALGADVNVLDKGGLSALWIVAAQGRDEALGTAKILVQHGANLEVRGEHHMTPLLVAINRGTNSVADFLIASGADLHAVSDWGGIIWLSIDSANHVMARKLIPLGIGINDQSNGDTPLIHAARGGYTPDDIFALLLKYGADPNLADSEGAFALHYAKTGKAELLVANGAMVDVRDQDGNTPLLKAVWKYNFIDEDRILDRIDLFVSHGADVNAINKKGYHPVGMLSQASGFVPLASDMLEHLLPGRPNFEQSVPFDPYKPVLNVIYNNNARMLRIFAANGAKLDVKSNTGNTLMHIAAIRDNLEEAKTLLEFQAPVNERNEKGETPLAVSKSESMRTLIKEHGGTL